MLPDPRADLPCSAGRLRRRAGRTSPAIPASRPVLAALLLAAALAAGSCAREAAVSGGGTIEMDEVDVASLVGGRLVRLHVDEGDSVRAGDTLAVLERDELSAELAAQRAQTAQAQALARDVRAGPRPAEIRAARDDLAAATAQARLADQELGRLQRLLEARVVSEAEVDRARAARDAARARRDAAAEHVRLLEQGSRRAQVEAAERAAESARAAAAATRSRLGELTLVAPISGVVLVRAFETGELVPAHTPVVTLGDPDRLWMRLYVAAPELPRVRIGAPAEVRVLGAERVFSGRVATIATRAEFTPRAALTEEERAHLVFAVKVTLDPSGRALKAGLPATARIAVAERPAGPP